MSHSFRIDPTPIATDDPRYQARLDSQHRLALSPGLFVAGLIGGTFLALPASTRTDGFPLAVIPAGITIVFIFLGIGLLVLAVAQGVLRLIPAFWRLRTSLEELPTDQRITWQLVEGGLLILGFGVGVVLSFLLF